MALKKKITISWSGGKDSAFALYKLMASGEYDVVSLHTIVGKNTRRVGLHGVHESLMQNQSAALSIPIEIGYLDDTNDMLSYETLVRGFYQNFKEAGITHIMFGDIFLEDLKLYRERLLLESGLTPVYPLWQVDSGQLLDDFVASGFSTIVCACNAECYDAGILGDVIDDGFRKRLPRGIDPCGENGEFHSFVFDGPTFRKRVGYTKGEVVSKRYEYSVKVEELVQQKSSTFYFQELLP